MERTVEQLAVLARWNRIALGLFAAGVLSFSGGLVMALAAPDASAAGSNAVSLGPTAQPGATFLPFGDPQPPQGPIELRAPEPSASLTPEPTREPAPEPTSAPPVVASPTPTPVPPQATAVPTKPPPPAPPPASIALAPLEQELLILHSQERAKAGLASLRLDPTLEAIARQRAQDMAAKSYFAHASPTGETAFTIMASYGYAYAMAGENIARNNYPDAQSASTAMTGFMNSPGHRQNILEARFTNVGVGLAFGADGMKYFAVVFAGK